MEAREPVLERAVQDFIAARAGNVVGGYLVPKCGSVSQSVRQSNEISDPVPATWLGTLLHRCYNQIE